MGTEGKERGAVVRGRRKEGNRQEAEERGKHNIMQLALCPGDAAQTTRHVFKTPNHEASQQNAFPGDPGEIQLPGLRSPMVTMWRS